MNWEPEQKYQEWTQGSYSNTVSKKTTMMVHHTSLAFLTVVSAQWPWHVALLAERCFALSCNLVHHQVDILHPLFVNIPRRGETSKTKHVIDTSENPRKVHDACPHSVVAQLILLNV